MFEKIASIPNRTVKVICLAIAGLSLNGLRPLSPKDLSDGEAAAFRLFHERDIVYRRDIEALSGISTTMANRISGSLIGRELVGQAGRGRSSRYRLKGRL